MKVDLTREELALVWNVLNEIWGTQAEQLSRGEVKGQEEEDYLNELGSLKDRIILILER